MVALEAARAAELLPEDLRRTQLLCPEGAAADAPAAYTGHVLLGTGQALSTVTILFNAQ